MLGKIEREMKSGAIMGPGNKKKSRTHKSLTGLCNRREAGSTGTYKQINEKRGEFFSSGFMTDKWSLAVIMMTLILHRNRPHRAVNYLL